MAPHNAEPAYFATDHGSPSAGQRQRRPAQTMADVRPAYVRRSLAPLMASSRFQFRLLDIATVAIRGTSKIASRRASIAAPCLLSIEPTSGVRRPRATQAWKAPHPPRGWRLARETPNSPCPALRSPWKLRGNDEDCSPR